jgi:hypothetical protein
LRDNIHCRWSVSLTYKILKIIRFRYSKNNGRSKFLMEREGIVAAWIKILRKVHNLRISGNQCPEIYLDETWVNKNNSKNTLGRTHQEREAWGFLQEREMAYCMSHRMSKKQALFLIATKLSRRCVHHNPGQCQVSLYHHRQSLYHTNS